jgi:hypothetical protein
MYVFLFVLVPLAIVIALALAQDWKHRHRRHAHGADMDSRIGAATESAKGHATRWMLRVSQDKQAGLTPALPPEQVLCWGAISAAAPVADADAVFARSPIPAARANRNRPLPRDRWDGTSSHRRRTRWSRAG